MDTNQYSEVHNQIVAVLQAARAASVRSVNAWMTASYWEVGRRIVELEQQGEERARYGEALIKELAKDLTRQFGRGFGWRNLTQMQGFFLAWPPTKILQTASAKSVPLGDLAKHLPLPWSAYVRLLSVKVRRRGRSTKRRPAALDGPFANSTGRSQASFMSA